jgi:hypothetical protein
VLQRPETDESGEPRELPGDHAVEQEDILDLADEGGDGEFYCPTCQTFNSPKLILFELYIFQLIMFSLWCIITHAMPRQMY